MPESAIDQVAVDHVLPVADIPALLQHLVESDAEAAVDPPPPGGWDTGSYGVTCPECHGILHERDDNGVPVFVCRVGHRFSEESLVEAQSVGVEAALWIAVRALEERADFAQRLSRRFDSRGNQHASERMAREAHDVALQAEVVRRLLKGEYLGGDPVEPAGDE
jgi:two-component system chemotaxis response regulator CheB